MKTDRYRIKKADTAEQQQDGELENNNKHHLIYNAAFHCDTLTKTPKQKEAAQQEKKAGQ